LKTFKDCINALNKKGIYLNVGRPIKSFQMIWTSLIGSKKVVVGKNSPETAEVLLKLKGLVEEEHLQIAIDRKFSMNQIVEAHRYVDKGHKKGNVVITVNEEVS
jgi:NADPH:quinone reductase-like Zn-dependent oxidoreductase